MIARWRGRHSGRRSHLDEGRIRQIGWRLAILTAATICALLAVLGVAVYASAQNALLQTVKSSVVARASDEIRQMRSQAGGGPHGPKADHGPGYNPGQGSPPPTGIGREPPNGGVFVTVLGPDLHCISSSLGGPGGNSGRRIPSPTDAVAVLASGKPRINTVHYQSTPYLLYTAPARIGHNRFVIQASASEAPYHSDVNAILEVLLLVGGVGLVASCLVTGLVVQRALLPIRVAITHQREFVADAAHELRTPVSIIRSAGEMLIRDSGASKREEMAQITLEETGHLTKLVADLSLLARSDTGGLDFERAPVNLSELVRSVSSDIEVLAEERAIEMHVETGDRLATTGDAMRLRQVVLILLDNALKHTPDGGRIQVLLDSTRRRTRLRVIDSGPGIPSNELNRIFDRFYRSSDARSGEGSGLGLAIAESIVRAHKGEIFAANSRDGTSGAIFTVTLPETAADGGSRER